MLLTEIFDRGVEYKWTRQTKRGVVATFTVNGVDYEFSAFNFDFMPDGEWEVQFVVADDYDDYDFNDIKRTNKFNTSIVLSTVLSILRDFVNNSHYVVNSIWFIPNDKKLLSLYTRMLKSMAGGWTVETKSTTINGDTVVYLTRND